jgi:hypothetical protein
MIRPACMSEAELRLWGSDPLTATDSPCRDCTVGWYLSRLAEGRCNGKPGDDPERVWAPVTPEERRERNRARMARSRVRTP